MGNNMTVLKLLKSPHPLGSGGVVVVTGASSGIGQELSLRYASRGAKLALAARQVEQLEKTAAICRKLGSPDVLVIPTDVTDKAQCERLILQTIERFQKIDILILSAGLGAHLKFSEIEDPQIFNRLMDVNFFGYLYCTFYALPYLKRNKGQIIVLSSVSGEMGLPYRTAYCASKFAVTGFFESLRIEHNPEELAITIVCPPSVQTPLRSNAVININYGEDENIMSLRECIDNILDAADRRARKVYFPFKVYFAAYIRPLLPDIVDNRIRRSAKL